MSAHPDERAVAAEQRRAASNAQPSFRYDFDGKSAFFCDSKESPELTRLRQARWEEMGGKALPKIPRAGAKQPDYIFSDDASNKVTRDLMEPDDMMQPIVSVFRTSLIVDNQSTIGRVKQPVTLYTLPTLTAKKYVDRDERAFGKANERDSGASSSDGGARTGGGGKKTPAKKSKKRGAAAVSGGGGPSADAPDFEGGAEVRDGGESTEEDEAASSRQSEKASSPLVPSKHFGGAGKPKKAKAKAKARPKASPRKKPKPEPKAPAAKVDRTQPGALKELGPAASPPRSAGSSRSRSSRRGGSGGSSGGANSSPMQRVADTAAASPGAGVKVGEAFGSMTMEILQGHAGYDVHFSQYEDFSHGQDDYRAEDSEDGGGGGASSQGGRRGRSRSTPVKGEGKGKGKGKAAAAGGGQQKRSVEERMAELHDASPAPSPSGQGGRFGPRSSPQRSPGRGGGGAAAAVSSPSGLQRHRAKVQSAKTGGTFDFDEGRDGAPSSGEVPHLSPSPRRLGGRGRAGAGAGAGGARPATTGRAAAAAQKKKKGSSPSLVVRKAYSEQQSSQESEGSQEYVSTSESEDATRSQRRSSRAGLRDPVASSRLKRVAHETSGNVVAAGRVVGAKGKGKSSKAKSPGPRSAGKGGRNTTVRSAPNCRSKGATEKRWGKRQDGTIRAMVGGVSPLTAELWADVAEAVGAERNPKECRQRWEFLVQSGRSVASLDEQEADEPAPPATPPPPRKKDKAAAAGSAKQQQPNEKSDEEVLADFGASSSSAAKSPSPKRTYGSAKGKGKGKGGRKKGGSGARRSTRGR